MCEVEWSCPPKPTVGFPEDQIPSEYWTVVYTEHECYIEATLVCTGSIGACYGPGNYCNNVIQVWYGGGSICTAPNQECGSSQTGYICGEGTLGP